MSVFDQCLTEANRLCAFDPAHPLLRYLRELNVSATQAEFMKRFGTEEGESSNGSTLQIVERIENAYRRYLTELQRTIGKLAQDEEEGI